MNTLDSGGKLSEFECILQLFLLAGEAIEIILKMSPQTLPDKVSRNIVADITGSEYPEQV